MSISFINFNSLFANLVRESFLIKIFKLIFLLIETYIKEKDKILKMDTKEL